MTPFQQILQVTLRNVNKLLTDHRVGKDVSADSNYDDEIFQESQFKTVYDTPRNSGEVDGELAYYDVDESNSNYRMRRDYTGSRDGYPLTLQETIELQDLRVLEYVQLGFIPIEDLEDIECTSLFIANATDRQRVEPGDVTLQQVEEIIPLNFRLMTVQPKEYKIEDANIIIVDKVLEGLKYVLNPDDYINLSFLRRGYDQPTVVRKIEFVRTLNLEEFMDPYEVQDYLFRITVREQRSRSKPVATTLERISGNSQSAAVGAALANPLVVQVNDQNGDPLSDVSVSFVVSPSNGSLSNETIATDSNGRASTILTLGSTVGTYTVTASVSPLIFVIFTATAST